jgi:hypothetical protein
MSYPKYRLLQGGLSRQRQVKMNRLDMRISSLYSCGGEVENLIFEVSMAAAMHVPQLSSRSANETNHTITKLVGLIILVVKFHYTTN